MPSKEDQRRNRDPPVPRKKPGQRAPLPAQRPKVPRLEMPCPRCGRKLKLRGIGHERCYSGECGHCRIEIEAVAPVHAGGKAIYEVYPMPGGPKKKGEPSTDGMFPLEDDYHLYFPDDTAGDSTKGTEYE